MPLPRLNLKEDEGSIVLTPHDKNITNIDHIRLKFDLCDPSDVILDVKLSYTDYGNVFLDFIVKFKEKYKDYKKFPNRNNTVEISSNDYIFLKDEATELLKDLLNSLFTFVGIREAEKIPFNEYCRTHGLDYELPVSSSLEINSLFAKTSENSSSNCTTVLAPHKASELAFK
ncbi:hypothetical protein [Legionella impletisoli]|uniref:Uncharacterized protein n=1 Tax=Legionella impletisoli TaxID=343510 RepID=A0A917JSR9_9GAMM|nr:hypothetical protein [Legionella impletisoli]GGI80683.1 hypothetical protein GCM10007966_06520 [Legionella impletisoli]